MKSMGMRCFIGALCFGCVALFGSASWAGSSAATVEAVQGNLWINQGQGFKPASGPVYSKVGDSVMVGPGGSATVVYDDGCKVPVKPDAVTTIAPLSPCAAGSYAQTFDTDNNYVWGAAIIGVGAAAAGGLAIYAANQHSSSPTSP